jgi:hypothetical protein
MGVAGPAVKRVVTAYERDPGDALVDEWPITGLELSDLQKIFGRPPDDPMYECYPVRPEHLAALERHVDHAIDLERYEYFVEAYTTE